MRQPRHVFIGLRAGRNCRLNVQNPKTDVGRNEGRPPATSKSCSTPEVFGHSGDLGDIIYSLPTIRAAGGGILFLFRSPGTREPMSPRRAELIIPLLKVQSYIIDASFSEVPHESSFTRFRHNWNEGHLADMHLATRQLDWQERAKQWLVVDNATFIASVIYHRSPRYHNRAFPWKRIVDKYRGRAAFVGGVSEHKAFVKEFGDVPYYPTSNLLDLARVIAGSRLFIGNQSCPAAIAEGLKHPMILEVDVNCANCCNDRLGKINARGGKVELPELE